MKESTLDKALADLDIEDWLSDYSEILRAGRNEIRLKDCPLCGNYKHKLYINTSKRCWDCKRCGWGRGQGDICVLLSEVSGMHINDVRLAIMREYTETAPKDGYLQEIYSKFLPEEVEEEELLFEPVEVPGSDDFEASLTGQKVKKYALSRGLSSAEISYLKLRWSFKLNGFKGPFLIFPIYYYDILVGWQGRRVFGDKEPKYVSSDRIHRFFWPSSELMLEVLEQSKEIVLVEGVFDHLGLLKEMGVPSLCTFGKKISKHHIILLKNYKVEKVSIFYDPDAWEDISKAYDLLSPHFETKIIAPPSNQELKGDPGDLLLSSSEELHSQIEESLNNPLTKDDPQYWSQYLLNS